MQRVTDIKDFIANFDRMNPNDVSIQASLLNESSFEEVILFGLFKQLYIRRKVYVSTPGFHHNLYSATGLNLLLHTDAAKLFILFINKRTKYIEFENLEEVVEELKQFGIEFNSEDTYKETLVIDDSKIEEQINRILTTRTKSARNI